MSHILLGCTALVLCHVLFSASGVRSCKQYDVFVGLSWVFSFSFLATFFSLIMHASFPKWRLLGRSGCSAKATLRRRRHKYKTSLSSSQDLPLIWVLNFPSVFMASHLKTTDNSGTRMLVSQKLERTKVLKTVSSTFKILISRYNHSFLVDATIMA